MLCPGGRARSDSTLSAAGFVLFEKGSLRLKEILFWGFVLLFQNFRVKRLDEERSRPHIPEQRHEVGLTSKGQHGSVLATFLQDLGNVGIYCNHGSKFLLNRGDIYGINNKKKIITGTKILHGGYH